MLVCIQRLTNNRGQSLIQVIIVAAVGLIVMAAVTSAQISQGRETTALEQRLASADLSRVLTSTLNSPACNGIFASANLTKTSSLPFDSTNVNQNNPYTFAVNSIPSNVAGQPTAAVGMTPSPLSSSLKVAAANANPPGIQVQVTNINPPMANLIINFDPKNLVRGIKPLIFQISLLTSGPVNSTTISGCGSGPSVAHGFQLLTPTSPPTFQVPQNATQLIVELWGGGGGGGSGLRNMNCSIGGGGGGYVKGVYVIPTGTTSIPFAVGQGGVGGVNGGTGATGGTTWFVSPGSFAAFGGAGAPDTLNVTLISEPGGSASGPASSSTPIILQGQASPGNGVDTNNPGCLGNSIGGIGGGFPYAGWGNGGSGGYYNSVNGTTTGNTGSTGAIVVNW